MCQTATRGYDRERLVGPSVRDTPPRHLVGWADSSVAEGSVAPLSVAWQVHVSLFGILAKLVYFTHIADILNYHAYGNAASIPPISHNYDIYDYLLCSTSTEVTLFSSHGFSIGRGSSQHTTRRHEGGGGGDASARHRCGLFVAGATRRHALGDTRRGGRPGAHPVPIARPRLSARIDPTFSRHPPLTLRPLSRSTGLPRRGGGDHDGRRHRHRCPRARHELAGG